MADHTLTGLQGNDASGAAINGRYTYTIWGNWRNPNNLSLNLARNPASGTAGISIKLNQKSNSQIDYSSVNTIFSSIIRVFDSTFTAVNFTLTGLSDRTRGFIFGRRPSSGLLYPRGYYNK